MIAEQFADSEGKYCADRRYLATLSLDGLLLKMRVKDEEDTSVHFDVSSVFKSVCSNRTHSNGTPVKSGKLLYWLAHKQGLLTVGESLVLSLCWLMNVF